MQEQGVTVVISPARSPVQLEFRPQRQPQPLSQPQPASRDPQIRPNSRNSFGRYQRYWDVPEPPADKPWLKNGGIFHLTTDRYFRVSLRLQRGMAHNGCEPFYILTFVAHKPAEGGEKKEVSKTFAATLMSESEREQQASKWLRQGLSDTGKEDSEDDSTCARMVC